MRHEQSLEFLSQVVLTLFCRSKSARGILRWVWWRRVIEDYIHTNPWDLAPVTRIWGVKFAALKGTHVTQAREDVLGI